MYYDKNIGIKKLNILLVCSLYLVLGIDKSRLLQNKRKKFQLQMEKPEESDTLMRHLSIILLVYYHIHFIFFQ